MKKTIEQIKTVSFNEGVANSFITNANSYKIEYPYYAGGSAGYLGLPKTFYRPPLGGFARLCIYPTVVTGSSNNFEVFGNLEGSWSVDDDSAPEPHFSLNYPSGYSSLITINSWICADLDQAGNYQPPFMKMNSVEQLNGFLIKFNDGTLTFSNNGITKPYLQYVSCMFVLFFVCIFDLINQMIDKYLF